jgi:hypothetical protein
VSYVNSKGSRRGSSSLPGRRCATPTRTPPPQLGALRQNASDVWKVRSQRYRALDRVRDQAGKEMNERFLGTGGGIST